MLYEKQSKSLDKSAVFCDGSVVRDLMEWTIRLGGGVPG